MKHKTHQSAIRDGADHIQFFGSSFHILHRSFPFRRIASPFNIVAAQSGFISPVNFRFFLSGASCNSRILFFQPDANLLIIAFIRPSSRLLRGKAPHIQVIADRLQAQIHRIFLFDQSLHRLSSPACKWLFQLIWTTIRDCTREFPVLHVEAIFGKAPAVALYCRPSMRPGLLFSKP